MALIAGLRAILETNGDRGRHARSEVERCLNTGYDWHIDPSNAEWAEAAIELSDGMPSAVGTPLFTSDRFCPWSAQVIAVDPA